MDFERTCSTRNHPLLLLSTPQNCPNRRLDHGTQPRWAAASSSPKRWAKMGQQKKDDFFEKVILDHMECQNKCFWRVLSSLRPVLAL